MIDLKAERKKKGLTLQQVAKEVGISISGYAKIEKGQRQPSIENAKKIADFYGFEWYKLFGAENNNCNQITVFKKNTNEVIAVISNGDIVVHNDYEVSLT